MVEKIEWGGKTLALVVRHDFCVEGVQFLTPEDSGLQLGVWGHPKGKRIKAHLHRIKERTVTGVQEVVIVSSGRLSTDFYSQDGVKVATTVLNKGDVIILLDGGHGFTALEDVRVVEVKQGPYYGIEDDKQRLE
jgi:hypothetical protein